MLVSDFIKYLNEIAPFETAQNFDNVGLLIGDMNKKVEAVLIALDLDFSVLEEAKKVGVDVILTHHPIIFNPPKKILENSVLFKAIQSEINVIAMHTNLDIAPYGVSFCLAKALDLQKIEILKNSDNFGRIGFLSKPLSYSEFLKFVSKALKATVRATKIENKIEKVAVVSGAGGFALNAAIESGVQALVTGECRYNNFIDAKNRNFCLVEAGHFETEVLFCESMKKQLKERFNDIKFIVAEQVSPTTISLYNE